MRRVVVTGLGAVTPLAADAEGSWKRLLAGETGTVVLSEEWATDLPVRIAAPAALDPAEHLGKVELRTMDRCQQFGLIAAREAWRQAGSPEVDPTRLAVVVGSGIGGAVSLLEQQQVLLDAGPRRVSPWTVPRIMPNGPAAVIGLELGAQAGVHCPVSACASGAEAVATGLDLLRLGRADIVVVGGAEAAISAVTLAAFAQLRALSKRHDDPASASRPYDIDRDGFVLGEGAGILVLETAEHAARRGALVLAELAGAGITSDAHHMTAPDPQGTGAARSITLALRDAGLEPYEVGHLCAHATSTPLGDVAEARAIQRALGGAGLVVSGVKSATGHMLGAAGAYEAIVTVQALRDQLVPAISTTRKLDPQVELDVAVGQPRDVRHTAALSTSFGFGGHDVTLALRAAA